MVLVLNINQFETITDDVIEAAASTFVIGSCQILPQEPRHLSLNPTP